VALPCRRARCDQAGDYLGTVPVDDPASPESHEPSVAANEQARDESAGSRQEDPVDQQVDDAGTSPVDQNGEVEEVDEFGRRHVRRQAPAGTEDILQAEEPHTPGRVEQWRRRSATGAVLSAFAFGLKEALEPERKEPAIVMQTSGVPPEDLPVEAQLEQLGPGRSVVRIRPWLLDEGRGAPDEPAAPPEPETAESADTKGADPASGS
jgi:hypothetical protein